MAVDKYLSLAKLEMLTSGERAIIAELGAKKARLLEAAFARSLVKRHQRKLSEEALENYRIWARDHTETTLETLDRSGLMTEEALKVFIAGMLAYTLDQARRRDIDLDDVSANAQKAVQKEADVG